MNYDPRKAIRQAMMIARREVTAPSKASIKGQRHMLAYITPYEAELLMRRGGSGRLTQYGIPAFDDGDGDGDGPGGGDTSNADPGTQSAGAGNEGTGAGPTGAGIGGIGVDSQDDVGGPPGPPGGPNSGFGSSMSQDPEGTPAAANMNTAVNAQQQGYGVGIADTGGVAPTGFGAAPGIAEAFDAYDKGIIGLNQALGYAALSAFSPPGLEFGQVTDEVGNQAVGGRGNIGGAIGGIAGMTSGVPGAGTVGGMIGSQVADALGVPSQTFSFADGGAATGGRMDPRSLPGIHLRSDHRYADGGEIMPQRDLGADPTVQQALGFTAPFSVSNPMSVFPKPQRMWEDQRPGGAYLAMPTKEDITGHKAAQAEIGVNPGGKPFFNVSRDAVEETGSPGRGSATVKTNLFKQKAGWQWAQAPEGHEDTNTLVSINHRGKHHYALNAQFPKGVDLARYENAPSEPRLRPTTKGNVELGEQVGTIMVRGKEHPVYRNAIVRNAGGAVGYADGGMPGDDPTVQQAMDITRQVQPTPPQMARQVMQSPKLASTFQAENRPSVIVSPRPGKVGGPPVQREMPEGLPEDFTQEREPWSFATPNIIGASQPPPIQHPVFNEPRMEKITNATRQIFKNKEFHNLVNDLTGLKGLTVTPTVGTWMNEMEPSFILSHPDMTDEHARTLAHLLGFGFQQDATVQVKHNSSAEEGIPAMLAGSGKKLTEGQIDAIHHEATKHGMDFTITGDGKAAKFLHFGDETDLPSFMDKVQSISNAANLPELYTARTAGDLIDAQAYLNGIFRGAGSSEGDQTSTGRSPDLFRRIVDHVLAPYAKAVAGEGYRLSPERLAQTYALNDDEREHVRGALYPGKKDDRTTVPLMTGEEQLDVRPTGERGRASVGDVLYALQNRAAAKGQIDPGDFSDNAKKDIAQNIAREVAYHVKNSDKSAIGWYDDALKGAMSQYSARFPELETDPEKRMLFHALLGITSQGNDVYSNSIHAMRLYDQVRSGEKSLPEAVNNLKGSFGDKTRAIESNLLKFHHLLENNGYDRMSDLFNQTKTVGEWNKILREDKSLRGPGDDQLKMQGGANQKVTGWMVFGPKIGSFINNLHGDYSTLTADLWFSRTWNRLLGHNFIHTPLAEAKQYRDFRDALRAEYYSSNPNVGVGQIPKTEDGKVVLTKKGQPEPWEYGSDAPQLSKEEFEDLLNDPDKMLGFAQDVTKRYRDSQFKDKSDLRRRAKNWIENRELPVAAPRGDLERQFQQNTVEEAQRLLKKKYGMDISVADIQAALWFHEKELFGKLGVASEKAQPADYADAARRTMQLIDSGELYRVKSKEKAKKVKPQEEFASGGTTMPMRDSAVVERALRITSTNRPMVALADLFQRQLRGRPPS